MRKSPLILGVINVTPDSFSDGGRYVEPLEAIALGERLIAAGADLLDIGGESTRPGAETVSIDEECARVLPVVTVLAERYPGKISIDTRRYEVAREAFAAGATIVNDVTAASDERMAELAKRPGAALVLMHMQGEPKTMQQNPQYPRGVVAEVSEFLASKVKRLVSLGVPREQLWIDPGIGFGKTLAHNLELLHDLDQLTPLAERLVIGASRKRFLAALLGTPDAPMADREPGTLASHLWAYTKGASVFRVHDVAAMKRALRTWEVIENAGQ